MAEHPLGGAMRFCGTCRSLLQARLVRGRPVEFCPRCEPRGSPQRPKAWWVADAKGEPRDTVGDAARVQSSSATLPVTTPRSRRDERAGPPEAAREEGARRRREPPPPETLPLPPGADLFPYSEVRDGQREFLGDVAKGVADRKHLIANAPTGLGKTVSSLVPLVTYALANRKRLFFLTSKQSQHKIAVETLKAIRAKADVPFVVADVIGKQDMCPRRESRDLFPKRFAEFCRREQMNRTCGYYENANGAAIKFLKLNVRHVEQSISDMTEMEVCPYHTALDLAAQAHVVVCDYNYFFSDMRESMQERLRVDLSEVLLVVDEAHNLPDRIRDHLSLELNDYVLQDARDEFDDLKEPRLVRIVNGLKDLLETLGDAEGMERSGERLVPREDFVSAVNAHLTKGVGTLTTSDYESLLTDLAEGADEYEKRFKEASRGIATLQEFLTNWKIERRGLARIFTRDPLPTLHYKVLDPSVLARGVFDGVWASVLMSGTLHPPEMYRDLLGLAAERTATASYSSPFPQENRLVLVDSETTTAYQERSPGMYRRIAVNLAAVADATPGNVAAFFPSYALLEEIRAALPDALEKPVFAEERKASKEEKEALVTRLRRAGAASALLLGVQGGSLSEGYDYEDNLLKGVVVVGLPFGPPTLETQALIEYYEKKFPGRGRDYAYVYPAFNTVLQAAGRSIRSPEDRGCIVLMDKRFNWGSYRACYPPGFNPRPSKDLAADVGRFWARR